MKFLHAGYAVKDLEKTVALYSELFGFKFEPIKEHALTTTVQGKPNPMRARVTHGLTDSGVEFEMVQSVEGISSDSLIMGDREGISHLAFCVDDLAAGRTQLEARGLEMVYEFASGVVDYMFFRGDGLAGVMIQLVKFHVPRQ